MSEEVRRRASRPSVPLSSDRWKIIEPLIDAAVELTPDRRAAFLLDASTGDAALYAELLELLADYERSDTFLERPAAVYFAPLLTDDVVPVPDMLGGYRVERELGRGGTATVYLARDVRHDRDVALKVLRPQFAAALGPERFLAEIRTTALLSHPGILPLYDSGEDAGLLFYVMPYIHGASLRRRLEHERQLPLDEAVRIASDVANALEAAHAKGIIHRDIKPENILLQNGIALVADFGIALALSTAESRLTESGLALGTPTYMSPEQASGDAPVDARSDVYALGSVVYEMLAGEPPFTGSTATAILAKRAAAPAPPLRILRPAVPERLDTVVARALAREPVDRFRTAGEFADALRRTLAQQDSGETVAWANAPRQQTAMQNTAARAPWRGFAVTAMVAFGAALVFGALAAWHRVTTPTIDSNKIVIVPFRVASDDASQNALAEGLVDRLAPMLNGYGGPSAIDSRTALNAWSRVNGNREGTADVARTVGRRVGAGTTLFGTALVSQHRLTVTASLVDAQRGELRPLVPVTGATDSLQTLLDKLVAQILVRHAAVPEQTVNALINEPLPALRPYLDGRMAYRHAHDAEAIRDFSRALAIDSTFANSALDLAIATTRLLRQQLVCRNASCRPESGVPGFRDLGRDNDEVVFDRAIHLAWDSRAKLGQGDSVVLNALRGSRYPKVSSALETIAELEQAAIAAPDRAEPQYFLGMLMLYQGLVVGFSDAFTQAETRFARALAVDSGYLLPRARLVDVAAYERDAVKVVRYGARYLERDSTTATADYVRWRVAAATGNGIALRQIRARFDSLDLTTLSQIVTASQMSGVELEDADRAASLIIQRSADPGERGLYWGHALALNRGQPRIADSLLNLRAEHDSSRVFFARAFVTWDALFGQGDSASAATVSRARVQLLASDTLNDATRQPNTGSGDSRRSREEIAQDAQREAFQEIVWTWAHGHLDTAAVLSRWLRAHGASPQADIADMLIATDLHRSDAAALRARVDSASRRGCCPGPHQINLLLATAYERAGADREALNAVRRGKWRVPTLFLSTYLRTEARLAARVGDRDGAIRAYEHYLALRSAPEPHLVTERDSVQAALTLLHSQKPRATLP